MEHVDVVIVGAGLSGVGMAARLRRARPHSSLLVLESRTAIGGTWDLFRYPGVRSDSDMYTLGYAFRPWTEPQAIADGESIRRYILDTVDDERLAPHIRLSTRVVTAEWSSETATWTLTTESTERTERTESTDAVPGVERRQLTCSFLAICSGYYRYDEGYAPAIPGAESFAGDLVHPQHWPTGLDYTDKRVVIVGSGATAVTLVPAMAASAAHVTMLQRSPTWIAPVPSRDHLADRLRGWIPAKLAYSLVRAKNIASSILTYQLARRRPATMKSILTRSARAKLPAGFDVATHLSPTYDPWDQRLCAIPDGDLYRAISRGAADIVTDRIERITPTGVELVSGRTLDADVIVTATGLNLLALGGIAIAVDGREVDVATTLAYKGMMLAGVPNLSLTIGYTNASWTLKADLVARYVIRLLSRMERRGDDSVTPIAPASIERGDRRSLIDLTSGYVQRSVDRMPKQGERSPWRLHQNYLRDFALFRLGRLTDDVRFTRAHRREPDALALAGTGTVTVRGTTLRYRSTGDGPPILMLHGIGQSLEDFIEQHERMSGSHRVISVDLPGFAFSERTPGTATLHSTADIMPDLLDALGVTGAIPVVGNSLGGAVAMDLAVRHPHRVSALVLVDSAGFGQEVVVTLRLLAVRPIGALLMRPSPRTSRRTVQAIFRDPAAVTSERVRRAYDFARRPDHARTLLDLARDLGTGRGVRPEWRASLLAGLRARDIPILLLWGDRDRILPFTHLAAAREELPDAEAHVFERTGHMPQIERPDEFAEVVGEFLARRVQGASAAAG